MAQVDDRQAGEWKGAALQEKAKEVVDVIAGGGVAIIPLDVAYGIFGNAEAAIKKIFTAKNRSYEKPSGCFSNWEIFNEIQITDQRQKDVVKAIIIDNDLPFSTVAPFRDDHPFFRNVAPFVLQNSTKAGTIDMLLNAGPFHDAMTTLAWSRQMPILGSSANTSLTGSKYRLEDIDEPVRAAADIQVDGGLSKYHNPEGLSSTIVDLRTFKTWRRGVCYDRIAAILKKDFGIDLYELGMATAS